MNIMNCFRVKNWALKFGVDLWAYGRQLTRMNELQRVRVLKERSAINKIQEVSIELQFT